MPTHEELRRFHGDYARLSPEEQLAFRRALGRFVDGLRRGRFAAGLRVKAMDGHAGVWEMTWAPNGRATFQYGDPVVPGEQHIVWRRIGTHTIFREP